MTNQKSDDPETIRLQIINRTVRVGIGAFAGMILGVILATSVSCHLERKLHIEAGYEYRYDPVARNWSWQKISDEDTKEKP